MMGLRAHGFAIGLVASIALSCGSESAREPARAQSDDDGRTSRNAPAVSGDSGRGTAKTNSGSAGGDDGRIAELEAAWERAGESQWEVWNELREHYAAHGNPRTLIRETRRAVERGSPYWVDYSNHGNFLMGSGDLEEALASYERGLQVDEGVYKLLVGRGMALETLDRRRDAIAAYRRALEVAQQPSQQAELQTAVAALVHGEEGYSAAEPHYDALPAGSADDMTSAACGAHKALEQYRSGKHEDAPYSDLFSEESYVGMERIMKRRAAGLISHRIEAGDMDAAEQAVSELQACGLTRADLEGALDASMPQMPTR